MNVFRTLVFGAFVAIGLVGARADSATYWQKIWIISAVDGPAPDRASLKPIIGSTITLTSLQIINPLSESCRQGSDITDIRLRSVENLDEHFGPYWKWPKTPYAQEVYGWARCDGTNVGAFLFVSKDRGYLFFEDGTIVELR